MKRIVTIGALVLLLAIIGGPAFAQVGAGSVLPEQQETEVLPTSTQRSSGGSSSGAAVSASALADTGLGVADGTLLAGGLLAAGAAALVLGRRRTTR